MSAAEKLKTQPDRKDFQIATPGVDIHFEQTIGEGRVMRFSTTFYQDTPAPAQQMVVEHCLDIADKVKARYELRDYQAQLKALEKAVARRTEDVERISGDNVKRRGEIKAQIAELQDGAGQRIKTFEGAYRGTGRQGVWQPKGKEKVELDGIQRDIDKLAAELAKIDLEEGNAKKECEAGLARGRQDIEICKGEIDKRREILGLAEPSRA